MLLTRRPDALLHVFRSSIVREVVHASGKLHVGSALLEEIDELSRGRSSYIAANWLVGHASL